MSERPTIVIEPCTANTARVIVIEDGNGPAKYEMIVKNDGLIIHAFGNKVEVRP